MKTKLFSLIFFLVFVIQLYAEYANNIQLRNFSKPLIVVVLLAWLYLSTNLKGRFHKRVFTGLIFALAGDVFLMLQTNRPSFFIYGLIAFLLCHIFYIRAFTLDHKSNPNYKNPYFLWAVGGFAIFCSGLFFYLQPKLGAMQFPVLMYAIILTIMAIMAVNRYGRVNIFSFKLILYGALFFLLSDSALAVNKFAQPIPQAGALIMATYMIAQYLMVYGTIERKLVVTRTEI
ncbi:lysoplasmalogenase [Pedobacter sp. ISL-68]|uniref:lysoplasmalogenase n=1 Tax=unclassified Pedobacter TaxID=2628915 RepID=UPI001BE5DB09|nr:MULTISPECIES: lysoplasmalogenase [unclassified Pedobacter]MBT2561618.1 lysoplasmalogenase [Pedobacter sp. ISL-64]MBT2591007.1 lysoplasmalogenase [Pedobacter sp. ISL-68]